MLGALPTEPGSAGCSKHGRRRAKERNPAVRRAPPPLPRTMASETGPAAKFWGDARSVSVLRRFRHAFAAETADVHWEVVRGL